MVATPTPDAAGTSPETPGRASPEPLENVTVGRNDEAGRYEIHVGDVLAGFTVFEVDEEGRLVFPHTSIDHAFAGHGLGSVLVEQALTDVAARGETIVPLCPFVVKYLRSHDVPGLQVEWPHPRATAGFAE